MLLDLQAVQAALQLQCGRSFSVVEKAAKMHPALPKLLRAKLESDNKHYKAKHSIMRSLIAKDPKGFKIDSEHHGVVGITHKATGFRMHLPKRVIPSILLRSSPGR